MSLGADEFRQVRGGWVGGQLALVGWLRANLRTVVVEVAIASAIQERRSGCRSVWSASSSQSGSGEFAIIRPVGGASEPLEPASRRRWHTGGGGHEVKRDQIQ